MGDWQLVLKKCSLMVNVDVMLFVMQVAMFSSLDELQSHVGRDQLTEDLGGTLSYNHEEWIQHRAVSTV